MSVLLQEMIDQSSLQTSSLILMTLKEGKGMR